MHNACFLFLYYIECCHFLSSISKFTKEVKPSPVFFKTHEPRHQLFSIASSKLKAFPSTPAVLLFFLPVCKLCANRLTRKEVS